MMLKSWCGAVLLIGLAFVVGRARAVDDGGEMVDKAGMCKHTLCQHDLRVTLKTKDGGTYDHTFDVFPGIRRRPSPLTSSSRPRAT